MAYNTEQRRGLYHKPKARQKPNTTNTRTVVPIENNGIYPYMLRFLEWSEVKGLSLQTVRTRDRALRRFITWCDERDLSDPKDITKPILENYQKHLFYYRKSNGDTLSYGTQSGLLAAIKSLFKWLAKENHILYNPASEIELPRQQRSLPKAILSQEEVERVIHLSDTQNIYGIRDRAILELLYSTGIRRMELVNLNIYDVDVSRKTVFIHEGKGRKDRLLPLGDRALYWIETYQREVRSQLLISHDEKALFLTDYGEPWKKNRLSDMVKKYLYHARINKPGSCHLFRHAMATHMLDNGADIRFIQQMLGHADLSTTQIYTHVSIEKLREIHRATHPAKLEEKETPDN